MGDEGAGRADRVWRYSRRMIAASDFFLRRGIIVGDVHGIECPMIYEEPRICKRISII
jgi:hypothetical protein